MKKFLVALFLLFAALYNNLYAAAIAISPDKLKVVINEINENSSNQSVIIS
jgi:hypothetical protein